MLTSFLIGNFQWLDFFCRLETFSLSSTDMDGVVDKVGLPACWIFQDCPWHISLVPLFFTLSPSPGMQSKELARYLWDRDRLLPGSATFLLSYCKAPIFACVSLPKIFERSRYWFRIDILSTIFPFLSCRNFCFFINLFSVSNANESLFFFVCLILFLLPLLLLPQLLVAAV